MKFLYIKFIKKVCPHFCFLCEYKKEHCKEEILEHYKEW